MRSLLDKIERMPISLRTWVLCFVSVVILRMTLESFSGNGRDLYPFLAIFIHPPLFYLSIILSMTILLHHITKTPVEAIFRLVLVGLLAILIPPVVDFMVSGGVGNLQIQYFFDPLPKLIYRYLTLFGPDFTAGATYGMRVEFALSIIALAFYIFIKTHSWWKMALGTILLYTVIFLYGSAPALIGIFTNLPKNPWKVTGIEILRKVIVERNIVGIHFGIDKIQSLFSIEMSLIFVPLIVLQLGYIFYLWNHRKFASLIFSLRYLRLFFHYIALGAGFFLGAKIFDLHFHFQFYSVLAVIALGAATLFIWIFSLTLNDLNDIPVDKISNTNRLLVRQVFTPLEFRDLGFISGILALLFASILGYPFFVMTLVALILSFLYSSPPYRLKRFPILASGIMALGVTSITLMGYMLFSRSGSFYEFPINFFALLILVVALILNVKDIKDIQGDKPNGIYTIPTVFGDRNGKIIIALLFVLSYILFPIILKQQTLLLPALAFSALTAALIIHKKVHESAVFVVYAGFLILAAILVF